jgi:hypothetical protein
MMGRCDEAPLVSEIDEIAGGSFKQWLMGRWRASR